jgi:thymidine kinase
MDYVTFYFGAMYSNKSNKLICNIDNFRRTGLHHLLILPECADKDGVGKVSSRALSMSEDAVIIGSTSMMTLVMNYITSHGKPDVISVDEAQFLTRAQVYDLMTISHKMNIRIDCFGLRSSFTSEGFDGSVYLLLWADNLVHLESVRKDFKKNTMNMLVVNGKRVKTGNPNQPKGEYVTGSWLEFIED